MNLRSKNVIVTGASVGLGYSIAAGFLAEGANVAICARDTHALEAAAESLRLQTAGTGEVFAVACDVSSEEQVNELAARTIRHFGSVDILVNNAGVLGPMGRTEDVTLEEWRKTLDINFYGVLLPCRALLPHFRSRQYGKIVNLSGGGAASPRPFFTAYAVSKAAVVRLTENLAEEVRDAGIDVNAVAPGALNTRMMDQTLAAGPDQIGSAQFEQVLRQRDTGGGSFQTAVAACVYLGSPASDGITGKLISAPWDSWSGLHEHVEDLRKTDIFTLRRIVPADRERNWT